MKKRRRIRRKKKRSIIKEEEEKEEKMRKIRGRSEGGREREQEQLDGECHTSGGKSTGKEE